MTNWQRGGLAFLLGWCLAGTVGISLLIWRLTR